jgi:hypothetical protein
MSKFAAKKIGARKTASKAVIRTVSQTPDTRTYEGGPAYKRDTLSELFLLGVANFVGENTFYEKADSRDDRYAKLARTVAVANPEWFTKFVGWLRSDGNMRSASLVAAAEGVYARLNELQCSEDGCSVYGEWVNGDKRYCGQHAATPAAGSVVRDETSHKEIVASVLRRADEPGELIAYWEQHFGTADGNGRGKVQLPKPLKRGIELAVAGSENRTPLYTEYSALKYDTDSRVRFGNVLNLVHPKARMPWQEQLFTWLLDRQNGRDGDKSYEGLKVVAARKELQAIPQADRKAFLADKANAEKLDAAGVTWEWLSSWLGSALDAAFWEAMIPNMGYMALLRNLRNFDQAGISQEAAEAVAARLQDPEQVARSRQFPFRFWSAYKATDSLNYSLALERALDESVKNIPSMPGKNLIMVDMSGSMQRGFSEKSSMSMAEAAILFGVALAKKGEDVTLIGWASSSFVQKIDKGASVLKIVEKMHNRINEVGMGTQLVPALKKHYKGHDRVFVFSDMQIMGSHWGNPDGVVPANVPFYAFNLAGYAQGMIPSKKNRYEIGGLTDATFKQIRLLEQGKAGSWPWEDEK